MTLRNIFSRIPHHLWARNEARHSCHGVAVITRNTSVVGRGFDYPVADARRSYARGYRRASWRIPFGLANRTSVSAAEASPLKHVAKVSPARARRCFRLASGTDRSAIATESPVPHRLHSAPSPLHRANNRPADVTATGGWAFSCPFLARPNIASPGLCLTNMARS